jgi:cystathionine beta-lyase family protein involved in aluminum resistance
MMIAWPDGAAGQRAALGRFPIMSGTHAFAMATFRKSLPNPVMMAAGVGFPDTLV